MELKVEAMELVEVVVVEIVIVSNMNQETTADSVAETVMEVANQELEVEVVATEMLVLTVMERVQRVEGGKEEREEKAEETEDYLAEIEVELQEEGIAIQLM